MALYDEEKVQEEYKLLQANFADSMWNWANIEAALFSLYQCAVGFNVEGGRALHKGFFSIKGVEIRISVTDAVMKHRWPQGPHIEKWVAIRAKLDKQRKARGRLAHHAGIKINFGEKGKRLSEVQPLVILVEPYVHDDFPETKQDAINRGFSAKQLGNLAEEFKALDDELWALIWEIRLGKPPLKPILLDSE